MSSKRAQKQGKDKDECEDEKLRQAFFASVRYLKYLQKGRPQMITTQELERGIYEQDVESDDDLVEEFFSSVFERKGKERYEQGRTQSIYETIMRNYRLKYKFDMSEVLAERINDINSYQALEEIQDEVLLTPSPETFERRVKSIIEQYA